MTNMAKSNQILTGKALSRPYLPNHESGLKNLA